MAVDIMEFRRGFILASRRHRFANQTTLHGWNRVLTQEYKIFVHPEVEVNRITDSGGRTVVAIGDIFVAHGSRTLDDLLFDIGAGARDSLDALSGRFALLVFEEGSGRVLHDPLGTQSVFYTIGASPVVSSHSALIAECEGIKLSPKLREYMSTEEYRARVTRFLPGDLTLYENVVHLTPNNELDLQSGRTSRYWPREHLAGTTFEGLLEVWDEYFTAYTRFLQSRYQPVIGLTGGLDSRAVIATVHSKGLDARYITWDKMPSEEAERIPPLVEHLGKKHDWVRMGERPASATVDAIRQAAKTATGFTRGTPLLPAQVAQVLDGGRELFFKGLGGEVMRGPFNSRLKSHLPRGNEDLAYALYAGAIRQGAGKEYETTTRQAIRGFLNRANYASDLHGADVGDLIYWEQRMGTWTAIQHAEFSVVLNSHSAMNSRRIFAAAWGLPDEERFGPGLLMRLIEHYDPRLAEL